MSPPSAQEPLFAEERKNEIVQMIKSNNKVLVPELVEFFQVSPATIRNDLRELEQHGILKRTHGGAIALDAIKVGFELDNDKKAINKLSQKRSIALRAVELIEEGDVIILDTGTTTLEMAKAMKAKKNVTAVVNDMEIARLLEECEGVHVILVGGSLRRNFHCTVGPFAVGLLSEINVDKVFLATNGVSIEKGCTTPDIAQAEVKKMMVEVSAQIILLSDSSKLGATSFVQFSPLSKIDMIITDGNIDDFIYRKFTNYGCEIVIAE